MNFSAGIPDYVQQLQTQICSDLATNIAISTSSAGVNFSETLHGAMQQIQAPFKDGAFAFAPSPTPTMVGSPALSLDSLMDQHRSANVGKSMAATVGKVSSDMAFRPAVLSPMAGASSIPDSSYYDSQAMTADQIDRILRDKNSPFASQTFSNGRTAGQLLYDVAQQCGTVPTGPRRLNPALLLSIMGAESSFGTQGQWGRTNPFSIRQGSSFDQVNGFEQSLKIAANTMYNWSQRRPDDSDKSRFEFAGSRYCENYEANWKPNVEAYYNQFTRGAVIDEASLRAEQLSALP